MKKTAILICFLAVASAWAADKPKPDQLIPYKETPQGELRLHIFNPKNQTPKKKAPAIVFFFGGGWNSGSPSQFYAQSKHLAQRGMVAIAAEYRTKKGHGTDPRACVMDAKSAMRWVRAHAGQLGIDPNRIAASGGSAGGHLAAATATLEKFDEPGEDVSVSCRPQALALFNPVFDNGEKGYGYDRVESYWQDFSPMHNLKKGAPPTIVFLGTKDDLIPVETAEEYKAVMEANGGRCDLHLYKDQSHGFFNKAKYKETLAETDQFFVSLGWLKPLKK
ncbi:alpha/beta hydrolase [Pontiella sulfatireligans]|uniref:Acetylxylan esterase n=1 Tax=Pontiella sulfatireligans TaxID=2750658 RepID=A0A6C2USP6_9BACT|nr:alpha/beta hydrolase [Pontiella sulfatireligans]VGO23360.1 Acetylxylan esterase [Pontiella sulfatireligans]